MHQAAMYSLFNVSPDVPFFAQRETLGERHHLMQLIRRTVPGKFRAPPLPVVFGPGTKLPKGPAVAKPVRKSKKR